MKERITITKKVEKRGDDGYKVVSVRMKDETLAELDVLARETNRSRNELINILIREALKIVDVQ